MKIKLHYTYLIMALGFVLTGYITNLLVFSSLILVHEIGHYIMAKINNFQVDKIVIYPYGGITKINCMINSDINKELMIAISGIVMQMFFYFFILILYRYNIVREYIYNMYSVYNKNIIIFNILPIIPLDGSKIINLILYKFIPFNLTNKIMVYISFIMIMFLFIRNYYKINYTMIMTLSIILDNIIKYYKNIDYLFNRFLLERYLYNFNYNSYKEIKDISLMYKNRIHIFHVNNKYIKEKDYIREIFNKKR